VSSYGFVKKSGGFGKLIVISNAVRCRSDIPGPLRSGGLVECLGDACLDWRGSLSRYLLSERAKLPILRGNDFELLAYGCNTSAIVSSLRMEARHHKHRNKHKRRSCQRQSMRFSLRNQKAHSFLSRSPPTNPFDNHRTYCIWGFGKVFTMIQSRYIFSGLVCVDYANDR
jgi:hypothetical protein